MNRHALTPTVRASNALPTMRRVLVFTAVLSLGCGAPVDLPSGVTCSRTIQASTDSALVQALSGATSGTCVIAQAGTYRQALTVPSGVALLGEASASVELGGGTDTTAVVTLAPNAVLAGVKVTASSAGYGVAGSGKGARLFRVSVTGGKKVGLLFWCEEDCRTDEVSEVTDLTVSGAAVGLMTKGVRVRLKNSTVSKSGGTSLTSGYGVVASGGAVLEMEGSIVEQNDALGVLIDGAGATEAAFTNVSVLDNKGRGLWAQGLTGTTAAPRLRLVNPTFERNLLVGFGARNSTGVLVTGGRIAGTRTGSASGELPGEVVMVGDGLGLFGGTGELRVDGASVEANQRSQVLVDSAGTGVVISPNVNVATAGALGVVVQRTTNLVDAMNITRPAAGMELSVSAPTLGVPAR